MKYLMSDIFTAEVIENWDLFWYALPSFLDDFKRKPEQDRLNAEPVYVDEKVNSLLSAIAEALANKYNLDIPLWTFHKKFHLKDPFFVSELKGEYKIFMLRESPPEFRMKNIFVRENFLDRC